MKIAYRLWQAVQEDIGRLHGRHPRLTPDRCRTCQHKIDGHIYHPSGMRACAERGCFCRIHVWDR